MSIDVAEIIVRNKKASTHKEIALRLKLLLVLDGLDWFFERNFYFYFIFLSTIE